MYGERLECGGRSQDRTADSYRVKAIQNQAQAIGTAGESGKPGAYRLRWILHRHLWLALALALPSLAQAQVVAPDPCWNGRAPRAYQKHARLYRTIATTSGVTTIEPRLQRVGRSGGTEWATAVSFPIERGLSAREITGADVAVRLSSVSGSPAVNISSYSFAGHPWVGRAGSIEQETAAQMLDALVRPGYIYGGGVFSTRGPHALMADYLADDAQGIADSQLDEDPDYRMTWLSFFLKPAGDGHADLRQVTLTLYHCPVEEFEWRGRGARERSR